MRPAITMPMGGSSRPSSSMRVQESRAGLKALIVKRVAALAGTGWFDQGALKRIVDQHQSGVRDHSTPMPKSGGAAG